MKVIAVITEPEEVQNIPQHLVKIGPGRRTGGLGLRIGPQRVSWFRKDEEKP